MQKKIAFDVDGVLTENKYLKPEERTEENYSKLKPNIEVIKFIDTLVEAGFEISYITSRDKILWDCTWYWLAKHSPKTKTSAIFAGYAPKEKAYFCEKINYSVLVDDSIEAIAECDNTIVKGMLFIDQNNRRYKTREYIKFVKEHSACEVVDSHTISNEVKGYFK